MSDSKVSAAQARATAKWEKNNYDRSLIRFPKGTQERIKATGETINGFVNRLVKAELDGAQPVQAAQPQPQTTTATGAALTIEYPHDMKYNERIQLLIDAGITSSVSEYVLSVIGDNLDRELSFNGVSLWRYEHGTVEPRHK